MANDYQNADGTLNPNSSLVKAARGGGSGCSAGVTAYGGVGTYFADAVTTAKTYLAANGRPAAQKIIILLSDGDANNATAAPGGQNACRRAITMASQATSAGMSVITIAYGAPTDQNASCPTDTADTDFRLRDVAADGVRCVDVLFGHCRRHEFLHLERAFGHRPQRHLPGNRAEPDRRPAVVRQYDVGAARGYGRSRTGGTSCGISRLQPVVARTSSTVMPGAISRNAMPSGVISNSP